MEPLISLFLILKIFYYYYLDLGKIYQIQFLKFLLVDFLISSKGLNILTLLSTLVISLMDDKPCKPLPLESLMKNVST